MSEKVRWGIIGPGAIAKEFRADLVHIKEEEHFVKAIVGRSKESTEEFLKEESVDLVYYDIQDLINGGQVDCIYIATPHLHHYEACLKLLEAGIPVLCEKPLAINEKQVSGLIKKSAETGTFFMEGMWIRCLPSISKVLEIIKSGIIGEVKSLEGRMTYKAPYDEKNRYFNIEKGGGSLLDLGIYPAYLSYLVLGRPIHIKAVGTIMPTGADGGMAAVMSHEKGCYSMIESSIIKRGVNEATIYGENGSILISEPWNEKPQRIVVKLANGPVQEILPEWEGKGLYFEVIEMMRCLKSSKLESDLLTHQDSLELVKVMDEIRRQINVAYPNE